MNTGKSSMEHMADGVEQIYDRLLRRFIILDNQSDTREDNDYLTNLAKSIGFMAQTNAAISKSYKQEKRLEIIENKMKNMAVNMHMFDKLEEMQVKYR